MNTPTQPSGRPRSMPYEAFLREVLQDRELAAGYVALALTEGTREEALLALESVADALRAAPDEDEGPAQPA